MKKLTKCNFAVLLIITLSFASCGKDKDKKDEMAIVPQTPQNEPVDTAFNTTIEFPSADGLMITANQYHVDKNKPIIVLCHRAGSSRGEYLEIAAELNNLGFNCLAIDQRSGSSINGVTNETNARAINGGFPRDFLDAKQDVNAAIDWAKNYYNKDVFLFGSSYSAALALIIAEESSDVEKVFAFSPSASFPGIIVKDAIQGLNKPSFLTSEKSQQNKTRELFDVIVSTEKTQFVPTGNGSHGAVSLWSSEPDSQEYWVALKTFLGV